MGVFPGRTVKFYYELELPKMSGCAPREIAGLWEQKEDKFGVLGREELVRGCVSPGLGASRVMWGVHRPGVQLETPISEASRVGALAVSQHPPPAAETRRDGISLMGRLA